MYLVYIFYCDDMLVTDKNNKWVPPKNVVEEANITHLMRKYCFDSYEKLYNWSISNQKDFLEEVIQILEIKFSSPASSILDLSNGVARPSWFPCAQINIAESCFSAPPDRTAIIFHSEGGDKRTFSYRELDVLSNCVANGLSEIGFKKGNKIAVNMPMTAESIAIYLGIVKAGMVVVSIADSFASGEIAARLRLAGTDAIFTQDYNLRDGKKLAMYEKVTDADAPKAIVLPSGDYVDIELRESDLTWENFLSDNEVFQPVPCSPKDHTNILFSSGTTGIPKVIPWNHTTPIKCGLDAHYHQDIHQNDRVCWPTNLGWMMGPWLIYAALLNKATIALYDGTPTGRGFCEFVQDVSVTMLGLVPSIVRCWRSSDVVEGLDWSSIKLFSSSGEASNPEDYAWLMNLLEGGRPVIEYCGGTEVGGGYITSTVVQPNYPSTFSTPALGSNFVILDSKGRKCKTGQKGEIFLIPPALGMSVELIGSDHFETYYKGIPEGPNGKLLRKHGDAMVEIGEGYFQALGRVDDTMNLGGIKISSAEIERTLSTVEGLKETAAIAVSPEIGGPERLVIYIVSAKESDTESLKQHMQQVIKTNLNPLFKIHDVVITSGLPRTATGKVMRRKLREEYMGKLL